MSLFAVVAEVLGDGKLAARCPFCGQIHVWDRPDKRKVVFVRHRCTTRRAMRHAPLIALRIAE